ncbi:tyrosine-protein kinase HTK16-like [Gigantopelta aegis]|uniref:tyrosine-protein kinase HTK16-like n=1 Tax=Gigantopelta aegis TaxID=1735272 RepID=UPI001B88D525|nr:tyrosine-protein kinase HTK16-like [Gigantopelta aegis]XP_041355600.1 tyrosine-protein kinase HTK16-like [Gigantopelta aegis]XP_041355609.1 tyrosine-protein kinase HTK16-like [Gigantopelta aegis]XP_041355617.1 tyrosine-protein kinase HTK16-like [Gigantopelta aegis]XP_041355625.1 tyrosine-protein kinase HTK16-like [Gigantopelta aegis]XP_041355633.1 tyrosine-protein kinase HTK16-like [Gigantopelta aegis]XP_041355641.1 tyrosine-protein kinase HTK16-like [Gigantopelta aegis]
MPTNKSEEPPPPPPSKGRPKKPKIPESLNIIRRKDLTLGPVIGQGEFGSVLKGEYTVSGSSTRKEKMEVALKTFLPESVENPEEFFKEAVTMQELDHQYIVKMLGVCHEDSIMLVVEYIAMGSVLEYLPKHSDKISVNDLNLWAGQIANGTSRRNTSCTVTWLQETYCSSRKQQLVV